MNSASNTENVEVTVSEDGTVFNFEVTLAENSAGAETIRGIQYSLEREHVQGLLRAAAELLGNPTQYDPTDLAEVARFAKNCEVLCRFTVIVQQTGGGSYDSIVKTWLLPEADTAKILELTKTVGLEKALAQTLNKS